MCFCPELGTPLSKSAQVALGWDMWFPLSLCRSVEGVLAPEVSPNLLFIEVCTKSGDSVAVLQTPGDTNLCLYLSFLLKTNGWIAECSLSHISGKICQCIICCYSMALAMSLAQWLPISYGIGTSSFISVYVSSHRMSLTERSCCDAKLFIILLSADIVCCVNKLACL